MHGRGRADAGQIHPLPKAKGSGGPAPSHPPRLPAAPAREFPPLPRRRCRREGRIPPLRGDRGLEGLWGPGEEGGARGRGSVPPPAASPAPRPLSETPAHSEHSVEFRGIYADFAVRHLPFEERDLQRGSGHGLRPGAAWEHTLCDSESLAGKSTCLVYNLMKSRVWEGVLPFYLNASVRALLNSALISPREVPATPSNRPVPRQSRRARVKFALLGASCNISDDNLAMRRAQSTKSLQL